LLQPTSQRGCQQIGLVKEAYISYGLVYYYYEVMSKIRLTRREIAGGV